MERESRRITIPCVALLLASTACIERKEDTPGSGGAQTSSAQTEAALARVVPGTLDFSMTAQRIVELSLTAGGGRCPVIPGVQSGSLCSDPDAGVACEINDSTTELRFDDCNAGGTSIDGTIRVSGPSRGPLNVRFALTLGGRSASGNMTIRFGICDRLTYSSLTLRESELSSTLGGELQNCNGSPGGGFTASVSSSSMQPFFADVSFAQGVATIRVTDLETQASLYQCTWSPSSPGTADCQAQSG